VGKIRKLQEKSGFAGLSMRSPHGSRCRPPELLNFCNPLTPQLFPTSERLTMGSQSGTAPGPINSFTYSKLTPDSATFQWRPVTGASAYELAVAMPNPVIVGLATIQVYLTKNTTATAPHLLPNQEYYVFLWAYNASGGSQSNEIVFTTPK